MKKLIAILFTTVLLTGCGDAQREFNYGDCVQVVDGFYKGFIGKVIDRLDDTGWGNYVYYVGGYSKVEHEHKRLRIYPENLKLNDKCE